MTLTEAAHWTKRFGVIGGIGLVIMIIAVTVILALNATQDPGDFLTPNYACTELRDDFLKNKLEIPSLSLAAGSDLVFELETQSGQVDSLPRVVNTHKFSIPGQSLNAQGESKIIAEKLGFNPNLLQRRGSAEYIWYDSKNFRTLVVQARNLNFQLRTDFTRIGAIDNSSALPNENEAINLASNYLRGKGLLFEDYFKITPKVVNINIQPNGTYTQARSRADAELLRVDFYRQKPLISVRSDLQDAKRIRDSLEKKLFKSTTDSILSDKGRIDIYNFDTIVAFQDPNHPNISVYIGPKNDRDKTQDTNARYVYGADFTYWPIDPQACGTYQLIPPQTALETVQQGKGSLIYLNEKNGDDVATYIPRKVSSFRIYNITLGYYEPQTEAKFLQPVYIISGEATLSTGVVGIFHYYVPAIDYNLVKNKIAEQEVPKEDTGIGFF
ncbi:hypothetical protein IT417_03175 [bacterium]|nr:hypothetical protein [bacterium]